MRNEKINFKAIREAKGFSAAKMAVYADVSLPIIWRLEKGCKKNKLSPRISAKLAKAYGVTTAEVLAQYLSGGNMATREGGTDDGQCGPESPNAMLSTL